MAHITIRKTENIKLSSLCSRKDLVSIEFADCNSFPDLTPLRDLELLSEITVKACHKIEDLSFLAPLINLKKLSVIDCKSVVNVSGIQQFDELASLELQSLKTLQDISALKSLVNLKSLNVIECRELKDFAPLSELKRLEHLSMSGSYNAISLEFISELACLNLIKLANPIIGDDFTLLGKLKNLTHLNILNCGNVKSLANLSELTKLTVLKLDYLRSVDDFAPLGELKCLEDLRISCGVNADLRSVEFLRGLTKLTVLKLDNFVKYVDDISLLGELTNLTDLSFENSLRLRNLNALTTLGKLERLNLTRCINISDLTPIGELNQLRELDLSYCFSIADLKPVEKLPNLTSLNIKSCYLNEESGSVRRKFPRVKKIETDSVSFTIKKRFSSIRGKAYTDEELERCGLDELIENIHSYNGAKQFRFDQFKSSWEKFQLDEFEKTVAREFDKTEYYPLKPDFSNKLCSSTDYRSYKPDFIKVMVDRSADYKNPLVQFDCIMDQYILYSYPFHAWLAVGPWEIRDQVKYRYMEELVLSSKEQARTLLVDGYMASVEERYFWCAKLISYIEENCHLFEVDIESTLVDLMEFYKIDIIHSYDDTGFSSLFIHAISMLAEAAGKELSFETIRIMREHSYMYFSSYTQPSRGDLEIYAEKFKWEIVKTQLDEVYGESSDDVSHRMFSSSRVSASDTVAYSMHSTVQNERILQITDTQVTRVSDRAFRVIYNLIDIASKASEQTIANTLSFSIREVHHCISLMSAINAESYTKKLLELKKIDQPQCKKRVAELFKELDIQ